MMAVGAVETACEREAMVVDRADEEEAEEEGTGIAIMKADRARSFCALTWILYY